MFELLNIHFIVFQIIHINGTTMCWDNATAGVDIFRNCGLGNDFLKTALLPWEWITGGYFSMILVAILVVISYIKYQKVVYPILIGTLFLPTTYYLFPSQFLSFAFVMTGVAVAALIYYVFISQTNES